MADDFCSNWHKSRQNGTKVVSGFFHWNKSRYTRIMLL